MSNHTQRTSGNKWPEETDGDLEYVWNGSPIRDDFGTEIEFEEPMTGRTCFYAHYFAGGGLSDDECSVDLDISCGSDIEEFVEWVNAKYPETIGSACCIEGSYNTEHGFEVYTYNPKLTSEQFDEIVAEYNRMKEAEEEAELDEDDDEDEEELETETDEDAKA